MTPEEIAQNEADKAEFLAELASFGDAECDTLIHYLIQHLYPDSTGYLLLVDNAEVSGDPTINKLAIRASIDKKKAALLCAAAGIELVKDWKREREATE